MACCGKQEEDANNLNTQGFNKDVHSNDKIRRIVKIQSLFRSYMARKRVKAIREGTGTKSMMNNFNYNGPENYENPEVIVRNSCI